MPQFAARACLESPRLRVFCEALAGAILPRRSVIKATPPGLRNEGARK